MKKLLLLLSIINYSLLINNCFAQTPNAIPYQAVARNAAGNIIASQPVSLRVSIHDGTAAGTVVYKETHSTTTTALGLFNVNIGSGTVITGTLAAVNWGSAAKFLQVELDPLGGTAYTNMGTTQLNSVPYALHAGGSADNKWTSSGNNIYNLNSGNVGIGAASPQSNLHVNGTSIFGTGSDALPSVNTRAFFNYVNGGNRDATVVIAAGNCGAACGQPSPSTSLALYNTNPSNSERTGIGFGEKSTYSNNYSYWLGLVRTGATESGTGDLTFRSGNAGTFTDRVVFKDNGNVGIGTISPASTALLDLSSTTKGFLPPRMTEAQRNAIVSPAEGLIIYCSDCGEEGQPQFYTGTKWANMLGGSVAPHLFIGANYQGGIVAYIYQSGDPGYVAGEQHGIIAAAADEPTTLAMGCSGVTGPATSALGSGTTNTASIISQAAMINTSTPPCSAPAASTCSAKVLNGYSDWVLPALDDLVKLYTSQALIGGFIVTASGSYWCSTSNYRIPFNTGTPAVAASSFTYRVRAVRYF